MTTPIPWRNLESFAARILEVLGMPPDEAGLGARVLVETDLRGIETHGVSRLGQYAEMFRHQGLNPRPRVTVQRTMPAVALMDADNGLGQVTGWRAVQEAVALAGEQGMGAVGVCHGNHLGALGVYTAPALEQGYILLIFQNASPVMVPWGGVRPALGNNPFAIGFPGGSLPPLVLDLSCSTTARGRIILANKEGRSIPEGWAVDRDGRPTTDPAAALDGAVLPMAGHKGFALAVMVDLLAGVLTGAGLPSEIPQMVGPKANPGEPRKMGYLVLALKASAFMGADRLHERVQRYVLELKSTPLAEGVPEIFMPGERSWRERERRLGGGIPLGDGVRRELRALAAQLGVAAPTEL